MTETDCLQVRFAKRNLLGVAFVLLLALAAVAVVVPPLSSPAAYAALLQEQSGGASCRLCAVPYSQAILITGVVLGGALIVVAVGCATAILRAFGPPALTICADGRATYRLPWRTVRFTLSPNGRIVVGSRFAFDPPAVADDGSAVAAINLRPQVTDMSARAIRGRLSTLQSDWRVEG